MQKPRGFLKYLHYKELKIISDTKNSRRGSTQGSLYLLSEIYFSSLKLSGAQKSESHFTKTGKARDKQDDFVTKLKLLTLNMPNSPHVKPNTKHQPFRTNSGRFSSVWALGIPMKCDRKSWLARS